MIDDPLAGLVLALYVVGIAWIESELGAFQDLPAKWKSVWNSLIAVAAPTVALWLTPVWRTEFGDAETVVTQAFMAIGVPLLMWLVNQGAYYARLWFGAKKVQWKKLALTESG
jgi:hypothetical protein